MTMRPWRRILFRMATPGMLLLLAWGCGGGGDGGVGGTGVVASGAITGTGSVVVNGVTYNTAGASFEREGEAPRILDNSNQDGLLQVGMVIRVEGALDAGGVTGQARRIAFEDIVEGPVESVSASSAGVTTAVVLGQQIVAEGGVPGLDVLIPGAVVEVSGLVRPDSSINATFIRSTGAAAFEVLGRIVDQPTGNTFRIGALTVDFSAAELRDLEQTPNGELEIGTLVEVKGGVLAGTTLTATSVEVRLPGLGIADLGQGEVEGFVADLTATTFTLDGQPVDYSTAEFDQGLVTDLVEGVKVEAQGPIVAGILVARSVKFEDEIKLEANLASIDLLSGEIRLRGLESVVVETNLALTELDDGLTLDALQVGDHLRVRGHGDGSGTRVRATQLRRLVPAPGNTNLVLQGPVRTFSRLAQDVDVLGVVVNTAGIEEGSFRIEDAPVGGSAFYAALAVGTLVKTGGRFDAATGQAVWDEIGIED